MSSLMREHFEFRGEVQGVGFRYRMTYLARSLGVTGWVRNEYDGSVTAELQGREEQIDRIIRKIAEDRHIYLEDMSRKRIALEEEERGFSVRY